MPMSSDARERSIPGIVIDLIGQFSTLLRQESQLARAEISENVTRAIVGAAMAAAAAVLLVPALVILLMAAVYGLETTALSPAWSALIVGAAALMIGAIVMLIGIAKLKTMSLIPRKAIHQFQEDAALARSQVDGEEERTTNGFQRAA
jgi:hypothetical protein